MDFEAITVEEADGVTTIALNRPEALNAITITMLEELRSAVKAASKSDEVSAIVITGTGRAFSAGLDLKDLQSRKADAGDIGDIVNKPARKLIKAIRKSPKPVIAKINGFCFTGALELALACDLIWVAEEAKLGDTHAKWGLRPTWGMSARLPNAVGMRKAKELSFTADTFTGAQAAECGLANRAVPLEELDASVKELTDKLVANSSGSLEAYKILYNKGGIQSEKNALSFEGDFEFEIPDSADRLAEFTKKD
ncbi:MAG: enoyl-CoA hydratase/isomerase family protein [Candidatus Hydrogenedentota bacterium]